MSKTGQRAADFYLGRGTEAQYLGTRFGHRVWGHAMPQFVLGFQEIDGVYTEDRYRRDVADLATTTEWPHDYASSTQSAWTVCFDAGSVYIYRNGVEMAVLRCNYRHWVPGHIARPQGDYDQEEFVPRRGSRFPTMQKVTT